MKVLLTKIRRRVRPNAPANCREVAIYLHAYLDGELDDRAVARVAAHLEVCRRCGLEATTYHALKRALVRRSAPPPDALSRLHHFAEQLATQGPR